MKHLKKIILSLSFLALLFLPATSFAAAPQLFKVCDINQQANGQTNHQIAKSPLCPNPDTTQDPVIHVIRVAADIIAILTGIAAVILIIASGLTLVASAGNQEAVANSRKRITAAVVGLVIVALAWTLVTFVTDKLIK